MSSLEQLNPEKLGIYFLVGLMCGWHQNFCTTPKVNKKREHHVQWQLLVVVFITPIAFAAH